MKDSGKKILIATSEAVPFVKTGGLADVSGALPQALKKKGHDVRIVLPRYWSISKEKYNLSTIISPMGVKMGNCEMWCSVLQGDVNGVPVYFIDHEHFFGRAGVYDDGVRAYDDNAARYAFFCRACLQLCHDLGFAPDIIHANDWPTALIPAYLKVWHKEDSFLTHTASVFSIHNIGYQGSFPVFYKDFVGLGDDNFHEDRMESHGDLHYMKAALFYADAISTVSPSYSEEILSPIGGNGMAPYIERRRADLFGI